MNSYETLLAAGREEEYTRFAGRTGATMPGATAVGSVAGVLCRLLTASAWGKPRDIDGVEAQLCYDHRNLL